MLSGTQRRWWLPAIVAVGLLCLLFVHNGFNSSTNVQADVQAGSESGILVVPVQIGRDSYGIAMVDTVGQNLWVYELNSRGPAHSRLKLLAARNWRYDRLLQQYNTAEPQPEQVKALLESLQQTPKEQNKE